MFKLRAYQDKAINDIRHAIAAGNRRPLLVAPTGSGKTVIAAQIVKSAAEKNRRVMFLAHRRELVNQCADKLETFGVDHGIIMAGEELYGSADCQVASIDTLRARCLKSNRLPLPSSDVIIIDEAHRSLAPTYRALIEAYPKAVVLGLTATPIRADGKGLAHIYDSLVQCPTIQQLTDFGHLVPARTFAPTIPDLTGIKISKGDYDEKELAALMDRRSLVGDIIGHWHRLASDRPTVVFASSVKHSIHLRDEFGKMGVSAAHVDGDTPIGDRNQIIRDLKVGKVQVVCNYGVFTEGFDEPSLAACILARPTKNLGLYLQMAGRTLRPFTDKKDSLIIDHSGCVYEHGFVSDERDWVLEEGKGLNGSAEERQKEFDEKKPITCVKCATVYTGQINCPSCGHVPEKRGQFVESRSGDLMEVRAEKRRSAKKRTFTMDEKKSWYCQLLGYAVKHGKSTGWVAHTYKSKFKVWPNSFGEQKDNPSTYAIEPQGEVMGYIRHRSIAYAKKMEKMNNETNNQASSQG